MYSLQNKNKLPHNINTPANFILANSNQPAIAISACAGPTLTHGSRPHPRPRSSLGSSARPHHLQVGGVHTNERTTPLACRDGTATSFAETLQRLVGAAVELFSEILAAVTAKT